MQGKRITSGFYSGDACLLLNSDFSPKQGFFRSHSKSFQRLQCSLTSCAAKAQVRCEITFENKVLVVKIPFSFKSRKQHRHTDPWWQHYSHLWLTTPRIHSLPAPGNHLPHKASGDLGPWFETQVMASTLARSLSLPVVKRLMSSCWLSLLSPRKHHIVSLLVVTSRQVWTHSSRHADFHTSGPEKIRITTNAKQILTSGKHVACFPPLFTTGIHLTIRLF